MRKSALLFLAFAFVLLPTAIAQQKNEFSIFVSDISGMSRTFDKTHWYGGLGMAYNFFATPRISAQLAIAEEQHRTYPYVVDGFGGIQPVTPVKVRTYPVDVSARYHFLNESRWKPYLGLGVRYVGAPNVDPEFRYRSHLNPQVVGGVEFLVRPSIGIALDGKQLAGDRENYDPFFKVSLGVNWRF